MLGAVAAALLLASGGSTAPIPKSGVIPLPSVGALMSLSATRVLDLRSEMEVDRHVTLSRMGSRANTGGNPERSATSRRAAPKVNTWALPVSGYRLTARFGEVSYLWAHIHTGLDFAAPTGTQVRAVATGVVTQAGWDGAYGYRTVVRLQDRTEIWYCHQNTIGVRVGQVVTKGHPIGSVGATGNATGPHLHLEVRPHGGDPVDPEQALRAHGVTP